jgi:hypothetical protein
MKRPSIFGALLLVALPAWGGLDIQIIDCPSRVLVYSPILVTAKIENRGSEPVLVPTSGYFIEYGPAPEALSAYRPVVTKGGGAVVWLEPGSSWLFQVDLGGSWVHKPGRLFIAGAIKSDGRCQHVATGAEPFPLKLVHETTVSKWYECWSGSASSTVEFIDIVGPDTAADREALAYYESPGFLSMRGYPNLGIWAGHQQLMERFPTSQVTYGVTFHACDENPGCLRQLLDLQPSHPLTPHTRLQLALALLRSGRGAEVTDAFIDGLGLADGLKQYLLQQRAQASESHDPVAGSEAKRQ